MLEYRNTKLAVVEAKAWDEELTEGVDRFASAMSQVAGRRLTYSELTGKDESPHHETTGAGETQQVPF